jgi:ATP-dependent DNA helicase RecQ
MFRKNRVAPDDLLMNLGLYNKRKEAFIQRVDKMIAYTTAISCRSTFINHYFGDKDNAPCGICDQCLNGKQTSLSTEEFNTISKQVIQIILQKQLTITQLKEALPGINKQKAWKVIDFLQAEKKIVLDKNGLLKTTAAVA